MVNLLLLLNIRNIKRRLMRSLSIYRMAWDLVLLFGKPHRHVGETFLTIMEPRMKTWKFIRSSMPTTKIAVTENQKNENEKIYLYVTCVGYELNAFCPTNC